jgi:hypothetical protein
LKNLTPAKSTISLRLRYYLRDGNPEEYELAEEPEPIYEDQYIVISEEEFEAADEVFEAIQELERESDIEDARECGAEEDLATPEEFETISPRAIPAGSAKTKPRLEKHLFLHWHHPGNICGRRANTSYMSRPSVVDSNIF